MGGQISRHGPSVRTTLLGADSTAGPGLSRRSGNVGGCPKAPVYFQQPATVAASVASPFFDGGVLEGGPPSGFDGRTPAEYA